MDDGENLALARVGCGCARGVGASGGGVEELRKWGRAGRRGGRPVGKQVVQRGWFDALRVCGCLKEVRFVRDEAREDTTLIPVAGVTICQLPVAVIVKEEGEILTSKPDSPERPNRPHQLALRTSLSTNPDFHFRTSISIPHLPSFLPRPWVYCAL